MFMYGCHGAEGTGGIHMAVLGSAAAVVELQLGLGHCDCSGKAHGHHKRLSLAANSGLQCYSCSLFTPKRSARLRHCKV